jgi:hypothetical protein
MTVVQRTIVVAFSYNLDDDGNTDIIAPNRRHKQFVIKSDNYDNDTVQLEAAVRAHNALTEFLDDGQWPYDPPLTDKDKEAIRRVLDL